MNRFAILLDGDVTSTAELKRRLTGCRVIAADGGIRSAEALGIEPEVWLGDFDSAPEKLPDRLAGVERITFPTDKDQTDGELAIDEALARGADELLLIGAFGGRRADHALLHKTLAISLAKRGIKVSLHDGKQEGHPILPGRHRFDFETGTLFSVIGISDLSGLSISGVKWPLDDVEVRLGSSLTLSNEAVGDTTIELQRGYAILIAQKAD